MKDKNKGPVKMATAQPAQSGKAASKPSSSATTKRPTSPKR